MGTALVIGVGALRGVGGAVARRIAREGLHVVVAGRSEEKLAAVVSAIEGEVGNATSVVGDATTAEGVARFFDAAEQAGGVPELVVYNVGNNRFAPLIEMSDEFFEGLWRVCCFGGFLTGREAANRMLPAGGGSLIFTGATASLRARPPFTAFASAKAALRAVAHGMAREFGKQGLHVAHVVIDGVIDGEQVNSRLPQLKQRLGEQGMLQPDDIAEAYWMLHRQPRSAWTLELDLRPDRESF
ncbi:MAG: SDR family oxidoreductase [Deltaproteobacteria bacterium]|jgi:NAD(P)-dependent dehydrogenase (short-subunit alcohol dehydrogenase family)|nr:SDR family oxidoreductase [Deltaproteobacteria bacterium]MBW2499181.1 SDR family oxidoreductase [Deltaproteobacteria bacterium]